MTRKKNARLTFILFLLLGICIATGLVLFALRENISYFRTPTDIVNGNYPEHASGRGFRLGGMVEKGSLTRKGDNMTFLVTDLHNSLKVHYRGMPPDLFREGQGVIAEGRVGPDGVFEAQTLLAKHDEKYMPPEIAAEMKPALKKK